MKSAQRVARNSLEAQRRFIAAKELELYDALDILAEWPVETLKIAYMDDRLDLEDFEAVLDRKFLS